MTYWIKFSFDPAPQRMRFETMLDMFQTLEKYYQHGPIEFMILESDR